MKHRFLVFAGALCGADSSHADNLLQNPNFDSDLSGWRTSTSGGASYIANDGSPAAGSAQMSAAGSRGSGGILQCVAVGALPLPWEIKERVRVIYQGSGAFLFINATFYPTVDCSGLIAIQTPLTQGSPVPGVQGDFDRYALIVTNDPMPGSQPTQSLTIGVGATTFANSVTVNLDSAYVGPPDPSPVTLTGFDVQ